MTQSSVAFRFCGFGGQGIVLSSVVLGTAAVTRAGLNAVQTQSYGSEARGGECQAELTVSTGPIHSPIADQVDILVAMSQPALDRHLDRLRPGGTLLLDPELVVEPERSDIRVARVAATAIAGAIGNRLVANMVMLGFLRQATNLITEEALYETIREHVPERLLDMNLTAARQGMSIAQDTCFVLGI